MPDRSDIAELLQQERKDERARLCAYGAPVFAVPLEHGGWKLVQGNCHHWDCPRCGMELARENYGRMVLGVVPGKSWYLLTITTRGTGISPGEADSSWLLWSNRLFTRLRHNAKITGQAWEYVTVTERQARGHPHSHTIMSWCPIDGVLKQRWEYETVGGKKRRRYLWYDEEKTVPKMTIRSAWLKKKIVAAGFGDVYDFSPIHVAQGASRYIAKYLFKASSHDAWPDRWKRVRYSQSWPKIERKKTGAIVLMGSAELLDFVQKPGVVYDTNDAELTVKIADVMRMNHERVQQNSPFWQD